MDFDPEGLLARFSEMSYGATYLHLHDAEARRKVYSDITPTKLANLISARDTVSYLLVDCRDLELFMEQRLQFSKPAPFMGYPDFDRWCFNFPNQYSVAKFLRINFPDLLKSLGAPGYYKEIIVYDDNSNSTTIAKCIKYLLAVLAKWNADTGTKQYVLDGGYQTFAKKFPYLLVANSMIPFGDPKLYHINKLPKDADLEEALKIHTKNLNAGAETIRCLIMYRWQMNSLQAIMQALRQEEKKELEANLGKTLTSADLKCGVCDDTSKGVVHVTFDGGIYHPAICGICYKNITMDDNIPVNGYTWTKFETFDECINASALCPYKDNGCFKLLRLENLSDHIETCSHKKLIEFGMLRDRINTVEQEIVFMNGNRKRLQVLIMDIEYTWNFEEIETKAGDDDMKWAITKMIAAQEDFKEAEAALSYSYAGKEPYMKKSNLLF